MAGCSLGRLLATGWLLLGAACGRVDSDGTQSNESGGAAQAQGGSATALGGANQSGGNGAGGAAVNTSGGTTAASGGVPGCSGVEPGAPPAGQCTSLDWQQPTQGLESIPNGRSLVLDELLLGERWRRLHRRLRV
ncbi:MAG: hypothetical protein QM756_09515 [Polyangiaceae bacterium]